MSYLFNPIDPAAEAFNLANHIASLDAHAVADEAPALIERAQHVREEAYRRRHDSYRPQQVIYLVIQQALDDEDTGRLIIWAYETEEDAARRIQERHAMLGELDVAYTLWSESVVVRPEGDL